MNISNLLLTDADTFEALLPPAAGHTEPRRVPMRLPTAAELAALELHHPAPAGVDPGSVDHAHALERRFLEVMLACGHEPPGVGAFDAAGYRGDRVSAEARKAGVVTVSAAAERRGRWVKDTLAIMDRFPDRFVDLLHVQYLAGTSAVSGLEGDLGKSGGPAEAGTETGGEQDREHSDG